MRKMYFDMTELVGESLGKLFDGNESFVKSQNAMPKPRLSGEVCKLYKAPNFRYAIFSLSTSRRIVAVSFIPLKFLFEKKFFFWLNLMEATRKHKNGESERHMCAWLRFFLSDKS